MKYLLLLLFLLTSTLTHAALTYSEVLQKFTSQSTAFFNPDNLLVVRITTAQEAALKSVLRDVRDFVIANRVKVPLSTPMEDYLNPVDSALTEILNVLNGTYYNCIRNAVRDSDKKDSGLSYLSDPERKSGKEQIDPSLVSSTCISPYLSKLDKVRADLVSSYEALKTKTVLISSEKAREIIVIANANYRDVIKKILNDFSKLKLELGI